MKVINLPHGHLKTLAALCVAWKTLYMAHDDNMLGVEEQFFSTSSILSRSFSCNVAISTLSPTSSLSLAATSDVTCLFQSVVTRRSLSRSRSCFSSLCCCINTRHTNQCRCAQVMMISGRGSSEQESPAVVDKPARLLKFGSRVTQWHRK